MPPPSSAATSFINESTLPRITPSLASMRWMVGSDRPDNSASLRWSMPSSARAARSCAAVIMYKTSIIMLLTSILIFIMGKIRFQLVRIIPAIPTTCRAARKHDRAAITARLIATSEPGSGTSQSASCYVIPNRRPGVGRHSTTGNVAGCEAAPMDSTFGPHAIFLSCVNHWHQLEVSLAFEQLIWIDAWH